MFFVKYFIFVVCSLNVFSYGAVEVVQNVMDESEIDNSLLENIVLYGIVSETLRYPDVNITTKCESDLTDVLRGINRHDMWALKVLDASGSVRSTFVWGQNAWLGSKLQCDFLNQPPKFTISPDVPKLMDKHLISTTSPIEMEYKMIFLIIVSPYKIDPIIQLATSNTHRLGLCLPKSCSNQDIEFLSKRFFAQRKLNFQKMYNASMEVIDIRNIDVKNFLDSPEVSGILFAICSLVALVIAFNFVNVYLEHINTNEDNNRFFKCFSIYDNSVAMLRTYSAPNAINSINGIRTLICLWVLLSHCGYFSMYAYDNLPELMASMELIPMQPFFAIIFYVDVFFVLSALLLVYNFLKDERTLNDIRSSSYVENIKLIARKIIHRYIRLTPPFLFTVGLSHILAIYIQKSSSYYIEERFDIYCPKEAWLKSVFYIHNLFRVQDLCISWSWYLACDMQFYIIILMILFVYARNPKLAKTLFAGLFVVMTVFGIYSNVQMNLLPRLDSIFYHLDDFYIEPWNRIHSYLAGATVGYVMFQFKDSQFKENKFAVITYWTCLIPFILTSLFVTSFKESTNLKFALALTFGRYIMGLVTGSVVVMCHFGYGGILNKFLSSRSFVHINKTTYIIYLVHPSLIMLFNSNQEISPHFDIATIVPIMFGFASLSYVVALFMSPIVEIPFQKLSDEYIMKKSKAKK